MQMALIDIPGRSGDIYGKIYVVSICEHPSEVMFEHKSLEGFTFVITG